ncbi:MAG: hypothetical protein HW421_1834 [Ignavibacteria bacterium]|nr:hypothetical protein [Ignavibacteria bacterium]
MKDYHVKISPMQDASQSLLGYDTVNDTIEMEMPRSELLRQLLSLRQEWFESRYEQLRTVKF